MGGFAQFRVSTINGDSSSILNFGTLSFDDHGIPYFITRQKSRQIVDRLFTELLYYTSLIFINTTKLLIKKWDVVLSSHFVCSYSLLESVQDFLIKLDSTLYCSIRESREDTYARLDLAKSGRIGWVFLHNRRYGLNSFHY